MNTETGEHAHRWSQNDIVSLSECCFLSEAKKKKKKHACSLPSYSPRTDCWECTRGCRHETGDPPLHIYLGPHACTHKHSSAYAPQVCCCRSLMSFTPPAVSASSPISALTWSSPSDTHIHTHIRILPALCAAAAAVAMQPQHSTWRPKDWENPNIGPCG